jgi:hypothetical protein
MQVGPAISPIPEEALMLDVKEYAAHPLTFLRKHLADQGAIATREFIERVDLYPFISDLFGEWLHRSSDVPNASSVLSSLTREVIGNMTLTELCSMLQRPLTLLANDEGSVDRPKIASIYRELHLSSLAEKVQAQSAPIRPQDLEAVITSTEPVVETPATSSSNYTDFLSELKEAGVIIPPSAKERQAKVQAKRVANAEEKAAAPAKPSKPKAASAKAAVGVESMLSPEAREKIMTKIFRDDEDDFRRSMELINKAKDWKQASIYLDALFMRRKVDPYSKTATRLTDAVYARFNSVR